MKIYCIELSEMISAVKDKIIETLNTEYRDKYCANNWYHIAAPLRNLVGV